MRARTPEQRARHAELMRFYRARDKAERYHWSLGDPVFVDLAKWLLLLGAFGFVLFASGGVQ